MKNLTLTIIGFFFITLINAQYLPLFTVDSTSWNINAVGINGAQDGNDTYNYSVIQDGNDTLILGPINSFNAPDSMKISVTDSNSKAWIYISPLKKILIYDITLVKGDSFKLYNTFTSNLDSSFLIVDTTYIEEGRKIITFENNNEFYIQNEGGFNNWRLHFVEGVGPSNFFMYGKQAPIEMNYPAYIICKKINNEVKYESFWGNYKNCENVVSIEKGAKKNISIYPNPVSNTLLLSEPIDMYFIYDVQGKEITYKITKTKEINVSNLPVGIFYIKLQKEVNFKFIKFQKI